MSSKKPADSSVAGVDAETQKLIKRKIELTAKIQELLAESVQLNVELQKRAPTDRQVLSLISCW